MTRKTGLCKSRNVRHAPHATRPSKKNLINEQRERKRTHLPLRSFSPLLRLPLVLPLPFLLLSFPFLLISLLLPLRSFLIPLRLLVPLRILSVILISSVRMVRTEDGAIRVESSGRTMPTDVVAWTQAVRMIMKDSGGLNVII